MTAPMTNGSTWDDQMKLLMRAESAEKSEQATFEIAARLLRERDQWRDLAILALPFLEDAEADEAYKDGAVRALIKRIREANAHSYDVTTQPFDEPFRHVEQDVVMLLMDRATQARLEGTATGLGDALAFEAAADAIKRLRAEVCALMDRADNFERAAVSNYRSAKKAWNGGCVERALELARERQNVVISQGASLCDECNGAGGTYTGGVCIQCHGAGVILPPDGLTLEDEIVVARTSGEQPA